MNIVNVVLVLVTLFSINVFAQPKKTVSAETPVYSLSHNETEISGKFGMVSGAINLGVDYVKTKGDYGFGGYFFMQSSKEQSGTMLVNGVTAFGAMVKLVLVEKNTIQAYIAPGVGIAMIKDGSINGVGRKSDETVIGPTFKIGVQFIKTKGFSIGLERMQFANWLNDSLNSFAGPTEYYSVIGSWIY